MPDRPAPGRALDPRNGRLFDACVLAKADPGHSVKRAKACDERRTCRSAASEASPNETRKSLDPNRPAPAPLNYMSNVPAPVRDHGVCLRRLVGLCRRFITYFQPTPIVGQLSKTALGPPLPSVRATPASGRRTPPCRSGRNWDGKIIQGPDGKLPTSLVAGGIKPEAIAGYPNSVASMLSATPVLGPLRGPGKFAIRTIKEARVTTSPRCHDSGRRYGIVVSDPRGRAISFIAFFPWKGPWAFQGHIPDRQQRAHHHAIDRQHEHHATSGRTPNDRTARRLRHDQRTPASRAPTRS